MTTAAAWIAALLLVPAVVWGLIRLGWWVRVALARRRGPEGAEAALRRHLRSAAGRGREQVAVQCVRSRVRVRIMRQSRVHDDGG